MCATFFDKYGRNLPRFGKEVLMHSCVENPPINARADVIVTHKTWGHLKFVGNSRIPCGLDQWTIFRAFKIFVGRIWRAIGSFDKTLSDWPPFQTFFADDLNDHVYP